MVISPSFLFVSHDKCFRTKPAGSSRKDSFALCRNNTIAYNISYDCMNIIMFRVQVNHTIFWMFIGPTQKRDFTILVLRLFKRLGEFVCP